MTKISIVVIEWIVVCVSQSYFDQGKHCGNITGICKCDQAVLAPTVTKVNRTSTYCDRGNYCGHMMGMCMCEPGRTGTYCDRGNDCGYYDRYLYVWTRPQWHLL